MTKPRSLLQSHPSSSRERLASPHRPTHLTMPSPLAAPPILPPASPGPSSSHRRSYSLQSPPSNERPQMSTRTSSGTHRRTASSTPVSIRIEPPVSHSSCYHAPARFSSGLLCDLINFLCSQVPGRTSRLRLSGTACSHLPRLANAFPTYRSPQAPPRPTARTLEVIPPPVSHMVSRRRRLPVPSRPTMRCQPPLYPRGHSRHDERLPRCPNIKPIHTALPPPPPACKADRSRGQVPRIIPATWAIPPVARRRLRINIRLLSGTTAPLQPVQ